MAEEVPSIVNRENTSKDLTNDNGHFSSGRSKDEVILVDDSRVSIEVVGHSPSNQSVGKRSDQVESFVFLSPDEGSPAAEALAGNYFYSYNKI